MAKGKMGFEKGNYGSAKGVKAKASDLSKAQLKRAGATKAAAKRTVDIGRTKRIETGALKGRTVGPGGKPLTGSVKLANGQMAVYKAGKRVINKPISKDNPKPPPRKTPPLNMQRNAPGTKAMGKTAFANARAAGLKAMDTQEAKRAAAKRAGKQSATAKELSFTQRLANEMLKWANSSPVKSPFVSYTPYGNNKAVK